jgi:hypothetical protein
MGFYIGFVLMVSKLVDDSSVIFCDLNTAAELQAILALQPSCSIHVYRR